MKIVNWYENALTIFEWELERENLKLWDKWWTYSESDTTAALDSQMKTEYFKGLFALLYRYSSPLTRAVRFEAVNFEP